MIQDRRPPVQDFIDTPPTPPRSRRTLWISIVCAVVLFAAIGTLIILGLSGAFSSPSNNPGHNTKPTPTTGGSTPATNPSVTPQQAVTLVTQYYSYINAQDYQSAYNLWGSSYRQSTSYAAFAQGFATTQKDVLQVGNATTLSDGTVKVPVTVTATMADIASTTVNTYQGYYIVGQEQGSAKLLRASLQLTNSSNSRVQQAIATLNQYYTDINAKNYQAAYNLWGTAYHNSTSYQQFVAGFASTQSVSVTIGQGVTLLKEGSVKVPVTIRSIDKAQSGTVTHTYQGYYIIGTEGNTWQLFSASIQ